MQLSVIIVNYNVKYFLEQCLCSVIMACRNIDAEIIVIDNNSTDGSREFFSTRFKDVKFIWSTINAGFGKANNLALQQAGGDHILFLNPDTILPEDCLEKCLQFFSGQPGIGALGIKMLDGSGNYLKESKRGFPSPLTSLYKICGLTALFPHSSIFARYYLGHLDENKNHEADVLAGAFMMIDKKVLTKVGGFDEDFFMYGEDVDLSYRIQQAGYKNYYYAASSIIHFKGESTRRGSLNYLLHFYGAMSRFVKKHYRGGTAGIYLFVIRLAIKMKAVLSGLTHLFAGIFSTKNNVEDYKPCLVVANVEEYEMVKSILSGTDLYQKIIGRVATTEQSYGDAIGTLSQLSTLIASHKAGEIIFCASGFSVKEIIETMQQKSPQINYWFHLPGTVSIVGSSSKNSSGEYFAKEKSVSFT